jgi:hypothetical protein
MFTRLIQPAPDHFSGRRNPEMLGEKPEIRAAATWILDGECMEISMLKR